MLPLRTPLCLNVPRMYLQINQLPCVLLLCPRVYALHACIFARALLQHTLTRAAGRPDGVLARRLWHRCARGSVFLSLMTTRNAPSEGVQGPAWLSGRRGSAPPAGVCPLVTRLRPRVGGELLQPAARAGGGQLK